MHAEEACHRRATRRVSVDELLQVFHTSYLHLLGLDREVGAKDSSSYSSAVTAVAEVAPSMVGE